MPKCRRIPPGPTPPKRMTRALALSNAMPWFSRAGQDTCEFDGQDWTQREETGPKVGPPPKRTTLFLMLSNASACNWRGGGPESQQLSPVCPSHCVAEQPRLSGYTSKQNGDVPSAVLGHGVQSAHVVDRCRSFESRTNRPTPRCRQECRSLCPPNNTTRRRLTSNAALGLTRGLGPKFDHWVQRIPGKSHPTLKWPTVSLTCSARRPPVGPERRASHLAEFRTMTFMTHPFRTLWAADERAKLKRRTVRMPNYVRTVSF